MNTVIEWVRANPALAAALLWPTLSFVLTALFGPHSEEQLAKYPSWFASTLRVFGALGIDVPKLIDILKGSVSGPKGLKVKSFIAASALVLSLVGAVGLGGCLSKQDATNVAVPAANTAACILTTTAEDIAQGESAVEIVTDVIVKCGADAAQIATILDAETKAQIVATRGEPSAYAVKLDAVSRAARAADAGTNPAGAGAR